jgi:hypothetical protein
MKRHKSLKANIGIEETQTRVSPALSILSASTKPKLPKGHLVSLAVKEAMSKKGPSSLLFTTRDDQACIAASMT